MKVKLSENKFRVMDSPLRCLTKSGVYPVIGISDDSYRIINDLNEPVLYEKKNFDVVDDEIPQQWVRQDFADGEYYIDPPEFSEPGFFEDYFDGVQSAINKYNRYLRLNGLGKYVS